MAKIKVTKQLKDGRTATIHAEPSHAWVVVDGKILTSATELQELTPAQRAGLPPTAAKRLGTLVLTVDEAQVISEAITPDPRLIAYQRAKAEIERLRTHAASAADHNLDTHFNLRAEVGRLEGVLRTMWPDLCAHDNLYAGIKLGL